MTRATHGTSLANSTEHLVALIVLLVSTMGIAMGASADDLGRREATMWAPYVEWTLENPSYNGNPFDVVATVTFVHPDSGAAHSTEMFYAGDNEWRFRFTGTRLGTWMFATSSADPELDGHQGAVTVRANPNKDIRGFLTHVRNTFAIQTTDADDLRGYLFYVYMNQHIVHTNFEAFADPAVVDALLEDAAQNGFEIVFTSLNHNWLKLGTLRHDEHERVNPDLATFDILDRIIVDAHSRGMRWHFWAWGDESRKWTPLGLPGGANGEVDRRLQRYIAARLGPLPGWSMGYGFDLIEWTSQEMRDAWAGFLHDKMGWDHLLCTRGFRLPSAHNNITSYSGFGGNDLTTSRCGPADFAEVCRHIDADPARPSFYEERHSYLRDGFKLDMQGTRRLLWWQAMAGGLGGFYGFYAKSECPYPNPEQLRTAQRFWNDRFELGMERANDLSNGYVLRSAGSKRWVVYKENTDSIQVDLSEMPEEHPAVAVDAAADYSEIDLGAVAPGVHSIALPHVSDWAVAVGDFGKQ